MSRADPVCFTTDGMIEDNSKAEERLLLRYKFNNKDLFKSETDIIEEAYKRQAKKIAYQTAEEHNNEG